MLISKAERMLRLNLQFFGEDGAGDNGAGAEGATNDEGAKNDGAKNDGNKATETVLSSEAIQKLIQKTVDERTADLGKKISDLRKENETLKKANMTAEEIAKADKEEFEKQKAEVELQKRQIHAHKAVATAGFGDDAEAVVNLVLGDTDENTDKRLADFKSLVDKLVAAQVDKTFKANGRNPKGAGNSNSEGGNETNIAEQLGKQTAESTKQANDVLKHYL